MDILIDAVFYLTMLTAIFLISVYLVSIIDNCIQAQKKKKEKRKKREEREKVFYGLIDQTQFNSEVHDE